MAGTARAPLTLAAVAVLLAVAAAQPPSGDASVATGTKTMTTEQREALAVVLPVLKLCKDFTAALCFPPDRPADAGIPPPPFAALCLHDNEAKLTGECLTRWTALPRGPVNTILTMGLDVISPRAQFKRACDADVTAHCGNEDDQADVLVCLEGATGVSAACETEVAVIRDAQQKALEGDGSVEGSGSVHGSVPPGMTIGEFKSIDTLEMQPSSDPQSAPDSLDVGIVVLAAAGCAVLVAFMVLIAWLAVDHPPRRAHAPTHEAPAAAAVEAGTAGASAHAGACASGTDKAAGLVAKLGSPEADALEAADLGLDPPAERAGKHVV